MGAWQLTYWLIYYEDQGVKPELFTDESAAREHFALRLESWNCHLFKQVSDTEGECVKTAKDYDKLATKTDGLWERGN